MICGRATYCPLVQESVVELRKLLLGLFGAEVLEEVGVKVAQLAAEERRERNQSAAAQRWNGSSVKRPVSKVDVFGFTGCLLGHKGLRFLGFAPFGKATTWVDGKKWMPEIEPRPFV